MVGLYPTIIALLMYFDVQMQFNKPLPKSCSACMEIHEH